MLRRTIFDDAIAKEIAVGFQSFEDFEAVAGIEPERALNIGVGVAAAPLWAAFYASAGLGAAWWWTTAWTRAVPTLDVPAAPATEPEALEGVAETAQADVETVVQATAEPVVEAVEIVEAAPVLEAVAAAEPVVDATPEVAAPDVAVPEVAVSEVAAEPLAFAASDTVVAEPVTIEPAAGAPIARTSKKKPR
jgi:hypothetical protein